MFSAPGYNLLGVYQRAVAEVPQLISLRSVSSVQHATGANVLPRGKSTSSKTIILAHQHYACDQNNKGFLFR